MARDHALTLGSICLISLAANPNALAQPDTIELYGVVRDFTKDHPDFDVSPVDGLGHYAGNVDLVLSSSDRPEFLGGGIKVNTQWRNAATQPIAPHMFAAGSGGGIIKVANPPSVHGNATVDTWDSSLGPYGGGNVGPEPDFEVGATMPDVDLPTGLGPSVGDVAWADEVIAADLHCDNLTVNGTAEISGQRTILVEGQFTMATHSAIELMPGARLDLYVQGDITVNTHVELNTPPTTGLPGLVTIYYLGTEEIRISQPNSVVYATVIVPNGKMKMMPNDEFFGNFIGMDLEIKANAAFHADTAGSVVLDACSNALNDTAGSPWVASNGAITSADTYDQWYRDILGINVSRPHSITMTRNAGVYEYIDDAFYPLDGEGFGNEGDAHNNYFTFNIDASFTYKACAGQFIEMMSLDDSWLFIDGQMVIDLGGVDPGTEQVIELDRLNLVDGETYDVHLFHAHRHAATPRFHLRTNVELEDAPEVVSISMFYD